MKESVDVVVVGAGPYGLSLAAHLRGLGVSNRIFGPPMEVWRRQMPQGMLLKSDGFASNLSDPAESFPLERFCRERGLPYDHTTIPVPIETFIAYGSEFQQRLVPHLDPRRVTRVEREGDGFAVTAEGGETVRARRVVLAVGISHFAYMPPELSTLPPELLSHSSAHPDPARFRGQKVFVIGGGASAIDLATLMHESGVNVSVVARRPAIRFHDKPSPGKRPLWKRLRHPSSGLGPGWKSRFYTDLPGVFRYFPEQQRLRIVRQHLGPAPGWPMRERVMGKLPLLLERHIIRAEAAGNGVRMTLKAKDGQQETHEVDHVVAATGYRPDVRRLEFVDANLQREVRTLADAPVLSSHFESSVPGLYFIGVAAVYDFGPLMRFAYGADYTARKLAPHLKRGAMK